MPIVVDTTTSFVQDSVLTLPSESLLELDLYYSIRKPPCMIEGALVQLAMPHQRLRLLLLLLRVIQKYEPMLGQTLYA